MEETIFLVLGWMNPYGQISAGGSIGWVGVECIPI